MHAVGFRTRTVLNQGVGSRPLTRPPALKRGAPRRDGRGSLKGAHKVEAGTLYDCPLCGGARKLLIQTNVSDDPNYLYSFACVRGCDPSELTDKLLGLGSGAHANPPD